MALADILCTCGNRFSVEDDGSGAPHPCSQCQMLNVLPRTVAAAAGKRGDRTAVRSTEVLSSVGQTVRSAVTGLPPGTMVGPYCLVRRIGRGGMGSVYEATDERDGTRVALKVLSPELAQREDFVARFHRESRVLARLSDPRIVTVFFNGAADGLPFIAMEFVDGQNLEEVLEAGGPLDPARAVHLMAEAAIGLSVAADNGLIHRDVKPTNLLLDREGNLRIVDFGLAKTVDSESRLTVTGAVVGTPFYLSPEQGLGKPVDQRSDIYSLGATFYHLLCGDPPFDAESPVSIIMKHVSEAPAPLTDRNPRVPEPLARVVMRCLAKDPKRRYQDYDDLIDDLEAVKLGEPVMAPPQETSIRRSAPSFVVMEDLDEQTLVLKRASRVRRAFALALDFGVLVLLWWLVRELLPRTSLSLTLAQLMLPLALLYVALGDGLGGRSPGKRLFHLRVARPDGSGPGFAPTVARTLLCLPLVMMVALTQRFGPEDLESVLRALRIDVAVTRTTFQVVANVLYALVIVDIFTCLFTRRHTTLHDTLSGTAVFREERVKRKKKARKPARKPPRPDSLEPADLHSPVTVAIASAVVPGFGQLLNDQGVKGLVFLAGVVFAISAGWGWVLIIWAFGSYEAFRTAARRLERAREGKLGPGDREAL